MHLLREGSEILWRGLRDGSLLIPSILSRSVCMPFSMICETVVLLRFAFGIRLITGAAMELFKSLESDGGVS